jgi:hypothetical protein
MNSLDRNTSPTTQTHKGSLQTPLNCKRQSLLPANINWNGLLLFIKELSTQRLRQHGQDSIVCQEYIEAFQQLAFLRVGFVFGS